MVKTNALQQAVIQRLPYEYGIISQYDDGAVLVAPNGQLQRARVIDANGREFSLTRYLIIRDARRKRPRSASALRIIRTILSPRD